VTSSTVSQCLRKSFFDSVVGAGFTDNGFAQRGHAIEAWLVDRLEPMRNKGYKIEYMGYDQRSFYSADLGMSGTPDGLITFPAVGSVPGETILIEIKSIDPRTNKGKLPKPNHVLQVQQNMMLVNECLGLKIERAALLYIDASDLFDQHEFIIDYDEDVVEKVIARARAVNEASNAAELPAEGMVTGNCDYCSHYKACTSIVAQRMVTAKASGSNFFATLESESGEPPAPFTPTVDEMRAMDTYLMTYKAAKDFEKRAEEVKPEIKKMLSENNGLVRWGNAEFLLTARAGLVTFDKDKIVSLCAQTQTPVGDVQKVGAPFTVMAVKDHG